ncbi:hypothetical protein C5167_009174 [Papaver somniferum]|uniref:Uncharacterized protein n=1 Tax=Papaver somniferum TaxID=3469 RepID=A0A4Y7JZI9_PAPSO|nr:hypothetical protein C5167_009174 [Papaver somniferum]
MEKVNAEEEYVMEPEVIFSANKLTMQGNLTMVRCPESQVQTRTRLIASAGVCFVVVFSSDF